MKKAITGALFIKSFGARFWLVLFFVLTWLGVALLLAFLLREGRREAERKAEADALGASSLLEARLAVTLHRIQGDLGYFSASLPRDALRLTGKARDEIGSELRRYAGHFPEVSGFAVLETSGALVHATGTAMQSLGVDERTRLARLGLLSDSALHFSPVFSDRVSGASFLPVGMPLRDSSGASVGVLVALLDLKYLSQMFDGLNVGQSGVLALCRVEDGRLILHRPAVPDMVNQSYPDSPLQALVSSGEQRGSIRFRATFDGVERAFSFQRVGEYPLYVVSGLATADYLSGWRQTFAIAGISALLLFLSLSLLLIRVLRVEREEQVTASMLAESEARYRMLAENSHDVIWTLDIPSRCYTYVSPSIGQMCGYSPDEVIGGAIEARLTPESAARFARDIDQRLRRIAAGDKTANVVVSELELLCKDGGSISTESVSSYLLDSDGVARTILGITRNVSERKMAEAALRETNRQLHARIEEIGRLQVALQELAVRDSLTGLYNRRYLDETLEREVSRARREGNPLSLVMLDIDHFKRVNDSYGHQVGDEVLRKLATTLLADIRAEDVACRYGGEEFLILLPNMPLETAMMRAEAWRSAVEGLSIALGNFQITFTISLGVAAYPEHGKTPDDLTRWADQALYRAKNDGRNQVSVFAS